MNMHSKNLNKNNSIEILIAEDSPTQAEQLKHILEEAGYLVSVAGNGKEALSAISKHKPTLVVSDVMMPEMDGYQLCEYIKKDEKLRDIPVILVTSLSDPSDIIKGLNCGADHFITKPYDEKYLLARIRYIIANSAIRRGHDAGMGIEIEIGGQKHFITSDRLQIVHLLISTYEAAVHKNQALIKSQNELRELNEQLEKKVEDRTFALKEEITERKRAEEYQKMVTQVLELLNKSVEISDIIRDIIFLIKDLTGFEAVGIRLKEGIDFPYYHTSGFSSDFVKAERYLCARDQAGELILDSKGNPYLECMCGNVISGRTNPALPFFTKDGSFWTNSTTELLASTTEEDRQSRTRNRCNGEGYESVALIPLRSDSEIIGLLQLNDSRKCMLTLGMISFFERIGNSIGIALFRKLAEEAIKRLSHQNKLILNSAGEGILGLDLQGNHTFVNPAAARILGYKVEELIGKHSHTTWHHTRADGSPYPDEECAIHAVYRDGAVHIMDDEVFWRKDGTSFPVRYTSTPIWEEGKLVGAVLSFRDITERKRNEEALRASEAELHDNYFNQAIINMILSESQANIPLEEFLQKALNMIFSIPWIVFETVGSIFIVEDDADVLVMKAQSNLKEPIKKLCIRVPFGKCHCGKAAQTQEIQFTDRIDERHEICYEGMHSHGHCSVPILFSGRTLGVLNIYLQEGHIRDKKEEEFLCTVADTLAGIIVRKKAEEKIKEYAENLEEKIQERTRELEDANLELQVLNKELNLRRQEAEDANLQAITASRAKSDFLANMSHELRTPLNAIIGFSDMMFQGMTGKLTEQQLEYLGDIRESGEILLSLINDILDLAKVEAGKIELEVSELDLKELFEKSLVMFKEKALKHNMKVRYEVDERTGSITADERRLKQVMFNLLSNAFKFTPDGGSVRVKAKRVSLRGEAEAISKDEIPRYSRNDNLIGDFIEISVEDTGIGIRHEDIDKLFQPFQQLEHTLTKKYQGTGLGLTLCKRIVELHNGRIWVESEVGKGSKFTFVIPVRQ